MLYRNQRARFNWFPDLNEANHNKEEKKQTHQFLIAVNRIFLKLIDRVQPKMLGYLKQQKTSYYYIWQWKLANRQAEEN